MSFYLDFGDGTNITKSYLNSNHTFPIILDFLIYHTYNSYNKFIITMVAKDDDGGETRLTFEFNKK